MSDMKKELKNEEVSEISHKNGFGRWFKENIVKGILCAILVGVLVGLTSEFVVQQIKARFGPTVSDKRVVVMLGNEVLEKGVEYKVEAGSLVDVYASPHKEFTKLYLQWGEEEIHEYEKYNAKVKIPDKARVGDGYILSVNALYSDGYYLDNKKESKTHPDEYTFKVVKALVQGKDATISIDEKEYSDDKIIEVKAGTICKVNVKPYDKMVKTYVHWGNDEGREYPNGKKYQCSLPENADVGDLYYLHVDAVFEDGYYIGNTDTPYKHEKKFTFRIIE